MAKENKAQTNPIYGEILEVLGRAEAPMTLAEIGEALGKEVKSGHIVFLMRNGSVVVDEPRDIEKPATKEVSTYVFVNDTIATKADGKPYNYSETEMAILKVLGDASVPMTLADIAAALGVEKLSSGSINALVNRKHNVAKGEPVELPCTKTVKINTYRLA